MGSNSFGDLFTITTFGESYGEALGVVIDGCPPNISLSEEDIILELQARKLKNHFSTSQRNESDIPHILSGVYQNKTTGAPIAILFYNEDRKREAQELFRPGHANFAYFHKYGHGDPLGRASARETLCRVAAGAVAKKFLSQFDIQVIAFLCGVGDIKGSFDEKDLSSLLQRKKESQIFCPDVALSKKMEERLSEVQKEKDSIGGQVELRISSLPNGLGEPIYNKFSSRLAYALFSIPGVKAVELGEGVLASYMLGSLHNDSFSLKENRVTLASNHAGGILGGITTAENVNAKISFKPTPSIEKEQKTYSYYGQEDTLSFKGNYQDVCIAIRGVSVVEAMAAIVVADFLLLSGKCKF